MRTRLTGKMAIAATLIVGLGAAGCGSSNSKSASSTSTASTPALSKAAFLKQGNAICRQGNRKINADASRVFTRNRRPTRAERTRFAESAIAVIQSDINGIRALPAPVGDRAAVKKITDTAQKDLDKVKANPAVLLGKADPFKDANKLAKAYGLTVCAAGG